MSNDNLATATHRPSRLRRRGVSVSLAAAATSALALLGTGTSGAAAAAPVSTVHNAHASAAISVSGRTLTVTGLAFDYDALSYGLFVRVYSNSHQIMITRSSGATHRYLVRMTIPAGKQFIKVVAFNVGPGSNLIAGMKWVTATNPAPARAVSGYSGAKAIAAGMLPAYGWTASQMAPLIALWNRESGWNPAASNGGSGAYGIPQALPGSKMASAGADWRTNPATQIRWGLSYIKGVYGSPAAAWGHSQATGWY